MSRILTIAAHPDDEVLGAGAAMARHAAAGDQVYAAILGEGATARVDERGHADASELEALKACARAAAAVLGVLEVSFFDLPDNRFDSLPLLDIVKRVEGLIDRLRPDIIYTHHGGDLNVDHQLTFRAVLTATRPKPGQGVKEILAFEVPSATDWSFQAIAPAFHPNVFQDASAWLPAKLKALAAYPGEMCPFPHARSLEAVEHAARRWGSIAGYGAAEPFQLIRALR